MTRDQCLEIIRIHTEDANKYIAKKQEYEKIINPLSQAISLLNTSKGNISSAASQLGNNYSSKKATEKIGELEEQASRVSTVISDLKNAKAEAEERIRNFESKIEYYNSLIQEYSLKLSFLTE